MSNKTSSICREILNTSEVIQNKLTESVVAHLISSQKIDTTTGREVSQFLNREVHVQMNSLVDRVLKEMAE